MLTFHSYNGKNELEYYSFAMTILQTGSQCVKMIMCCIDRITQQRCHLLLLSFLVSVLVICHESYGFQQKRNQLIVLTSWQPHDLDGYQREMAHRLLGIGRMKKLTPIPMSHNNDNDDNDQQEYVNGNAWIRRSTETSSDHVNLASNINGDAKPTNERKGKRKKLYDIHNDYDHEDEVTFITDSDGITTTKNIVRRPDFPRFVYKSDPFYQAMFGNENTKSPSSSSTNDYEKNNNNMKYKTSVVDGNKYTYVYEADKNNDNYNKGVLALETDIPLLSKTQRWLLHLFGDYSWELSSQNLQDTIVTNSRLRLDRSYARKEAFNSSNASSPPTLSDLLSPRVSDPFDGFWISTPARILSIVLAYFAFPYLTFLVEFFVNDIEMKTLDEITSKFSSGIAIIYGTFISLTLSILYNRQRLIQDNVSIECSQLVVLTRNMLSLFRSDEDRTIMAGQCSADQIRTLVKSSRGAELMLVIYSDPYARMMELVDSHEDEYILSSNDEYPNYKVSTAGSNLRWSQGLIAACRDIIQDLYRIRAHRLSDESLALPPTHFLVLNLLTLLILFGYTISIIPTLPEGPYSAPADESSLLFAVLSTTYFMFYNFASDLNNPFSGVYQIRRSSAAGHLLQLKWLLTNHPLTRNGKVDFDEPTENDEIAKIYSPGIGETLFETDDIYLREEELKVDLGKNLNVDLGKNGDNNESVRKK